MDQEEMSVFYCSEQMSPYNDHIDDKFSDLITITAAEPSCSIRIPVESDFSPSLTRLPRIIEFRKRSTMKVKTVGEIRKAFDEHTYKYLPDKLEKLEKYFFKRIRQGASEDVETMCTARNVLNNEDPISRAAWRMITRLNVDNNICDSQYIKSNKRKIRLNGSKGGQAHILKLYESSQTVTEKCGDFEIKPNIQKYGLLQQSLNVAFRPGPLCKKTELDVSFQKKNIGRVVLVNIPEVGLEIKPKLGVPLEPVAYNLIQEKRSPVGAINEEWATFSVAALAKVDEKNNITFQTVSQIFKIPYKNNQNRILMREDYETESDCFPCGKKTKYSEEKSVMVEINKLGEVGQDVSDILNDLIKAVEISISEESFFSQELDYEPVQNASTSGKSKIKSKKKYANELARLDITVIQMSSDESLPACSHSFCQLGCICSSLDCQIQFNNHCGKVDCMFDCKCQFKSFKNNRDPYTLTPEIINMKNKVTSLLAKEEKKFHQTVVFSKNEPIVLGSKRRFTRAPKRYAEFIHNVQGKQANKLQQMPKVVLSRMAIDNVAPWCLVHQLYRCFCKNKYSESLYTYPLTYNATPTEDVWSEMPVISEPRMSNYKGSTFKEEIKQNHRIHLEPKRLKEFNEPLTVSDWHIANNNDKVEKPVSKEDIRDFPFMFNCSRTSPIDAIHTKRRKMLYYRERNERIRQLESKDKRLRNLLEQHSGISGENEPFMFTKLEKTDSTSQPVDKEIEGNSSNQKQLKKKKLFPGSCLDPAISAVQTSQLGLSQTEHKWIATSLKRGRLSAPKLNCVKGPRFIKWLEKNYINIKSQPGRSIYLGEPKNNKVSLYPWAAFQRRYIERKNVFLVSVTPPFRLFLTLTTDIDMLKDCKRIDNINRDQLEKYPLIISDLISKNDIEDCFVILNGRTEYWEAVGTVVKKCTDPLPVQVKSDFYLNNDKSLLKPMFETRQAKKLNTTQCETTQCETTQCATTQCETTQCVTQCETTQCVTTQCVKEHKQTHAQSTSSKDKLQNDLEVKSRGKMRTHTNTFESKCTDSITIEDIVQESKNENDKSATIEFSGLPECPTSSNEQSRWFVLTVESDFSEIRFYNEGFFVKHTNIMKAIALAQRSGETVALPNQSVYELNGTIQPKFGIYAVPLMSKKCVLLGPYDLDQVLGIETLCHNRVTEKKTRGNWIFTNKADNLKVIENPFHFIFRGDSTEIVINPSAGVENDNKITKQQFINMKDFFCEEKCNLNKPLTQDLGSIIKKKVLSSTAIKKTLVFESKLKPGILQKLKKMSPKKIEQVRPITIKKDNGFYRVASQLLNNSVSILKTANVCKVATKPKIVKQDSSPDMCLQLDGSNSSSSIRKEPDKTLAYKTENKLKLGLYILKPDQINDIINQNSFECAKTDHTYSFGDSVEQASLKNICDNMGKSKDESIQLVNTFSEDNVVFDHSLDVSGQNDPSTLQPEYVELNQEFKETEQNTFYSTQLQEKPPSKKTQREADVVCISSDEEWEEAVCGEEMARGEKVFEGHELTSTDEAMGNEKSTKCVKSEGTQKLLVHESWLVCRTVESLGYIKSKKKDNLISFQFPGFKESEFFTPSTAFDKINQLLARKVFVPPGTQLDWEIVTNTADVEHMEMLNIKYLKAEYVLTKNGLRHSRKFISQHTDEIKQAVTLLGQTLLSPKQLLKTEQWKLIIMAPNAIQSLKEEESKLLKQKKNLEEELELNKLKYSKLVEDKKKAEEPTEIDIDSFIEAAATVAPGAH